jgi:L-alanine-DL-glutamate epimerase-like enolase superfamily enzyme
MQKLALQSECAPVVGLMGESVLGTLAGLQFAATLPHPVLPAELTWYLAMTEQITTLTPRIVDGFVDLPACASLGALIDWRAVERLAA